MVCTFFGHRDTPSEVSVLLKAILEFLITEKEVDCFYVGTQGRFDSLARRELQILQQAYPHIQCLTVLAYLTPRHADKQSEMFDTVYPEGLETVPPRYALAKRNAWMVDNADVVVTYAKYTFGHAWRLQEAARKKGKVVYNLADIQAPLEKHLKPPFCRD